MNEKILPRGTKVIVRGTIAGVVLEAQPDSEINNGLAYRVIFDGQELARRLVDCRRYSDDPEKDFENLLLYTNQVRVMEVGCDGVAEFISEDDSSAP